MMQSPRVINYPVRVNMAGWRSDTHTLQRNGWEIAMEQNTRRESCHETIRIAMTHPGLDLIAMSAPAHFEYHLIYGIGGPERMIEYLREYEFEVCQFYKRSTQVRIHVPRMPFNFSAIDAVPQMVNSEMKTLDDMLPFKPVGGELIHVDPKDVSGLLAIIKEAQGPKQEEIRAKLRKQKERQMNETHMSLPEDIRMPYENVVQLVKVA